MKNSRLLGIASLVFLSAAGVSRADTWVGTVDDLWSTNGNWLDGTAPTSADPVIFNAGDTGGTNIVDSTFQNSLDPIKIIDALEYSGNSIHETRVNPGLTLRVNNGVNIGTSASGTGAFITWGGGGVIDISPGSSDTWGIGVNNVVSGTTSAALTIDNLTIDAYGELSVGRVAARGNASGILTLGSNSTLNHGTVAAPTATLNVGWNESGLFGNATGVFDASNPAASVSMYLSELNVGRARNVGTTTGTLMWNQTEAIHADTINFGRGSSTGILEVPAGGELHLGTAADPVSNLRIAYNDGNGGTANTNLDFTVTNPTFTADIAGDLSIGRTTAAGNASGSLTLGSNSTLNLGTVAAPTATLNVGWDGSGLDVNGIINGAFDASNPAASVSMYLSELNVGRARNVGTTTGTLMWNQTEAIHADTINFGRGSSTGILEVPAGGELHLGTAADPVSNLRIAYNDGNGGTANTNLDFTVTNPTFTADIAGDLSIGRTTAAGNASGSLTLGSNSTLNLGTVAAPTATLNVGWDGSGLDVNGIINGAFDASNPAASVSMYLSELNVGRARNVGTTTGTLMWNQTEAIHADTINFGRGSSTGILEVPAGGELHLGTAADPVSNLRIAYNDGNGGTANTNLDFTVTNPTFTADIAGDLSIGRTTAAGNASGSLTLGSNSTLNLGTVAAPTATLNVGWDGSGLDVNGIINGAFDASNPAASVSMYLSELNVGRARNVGTTTGTFTMGANNLVSSTTVNIGTGSNAAGTVNLQEGRLVAETINANEPDSTFNFTGGRLGLGGDTLNTGTFNGSLDQQGGTLAPGFSRTNTSAIGLATVNGDYNLFSAGTLELELMGTNPGNEFDQLIVNGSVGLNADSGTGGLLDVILDFSPSVGDGFLIVNNDGTDLVNGTFLGLMEGATFDEIFGAERFTFEITYLGGTGNDIVLNVASASTIPLPPAVWLFGSGLLGLIGISRRKRAA